MSDTKSCLNAAFHANSITANSPVGPSTPSPFESALSQIHKGLHTLQNAMARSLPRPSRTLSSHLVFTPCLHNLQTATIGTPPEADTDNSSPPRPQRPQPPRRRAFGFDAQPQVQAE